MFFQRNSNYTFDNTIHHVNHILITNHLLYTLHDSVSFTRQTTLFLCSKVCDDLLNLIRYTCTLKSKDPNNDWLIRGLIQKLHTKCVEQYGKG